MLTSETDVGTPGTVHKRKSDSPQKRFISPLSPEYVDMPLFSLTPQKQEVTSEHVQMPVVERQTVKPSSGSKTATITGAQRRKLMSPNKKRVSRAVFGYESESQDINFSETHGLSSTGDTNKSEDISAKNKSENIVSIGSSGNIISMENVDGDSSLQNIIHIYPQDEYTGFGMENINVPQPIFTVNTSPTKYMGSNRQIESLTSAKNIRVNRVPGKKKKEEGQGDAADLVEELGITIK